MRLVEAVVLGIVQGATEFIPVSSSAHLRVVPVLMGWHDPGAAFTAVVQLGTMAAVLLAFRRDVRDLTIGGMQLLRDRGKAHTDATRTARAVTLGSLPILVVGVVVAPLVEGPFRNLAVIAAALIVGTVWLGLTTRRAGQRSLDTVNDRDALLVGFAQVAALVPGVSRSGATIGAGYRQGFSPLAATRFSFWLSIPAIVASGLWEARHIGGGLQLAPTLVATVVAFLVGLASISVLLRLASNGRFREMLLYRVVFAGVTIGLAL